MPALFLIVVIDLVGFGLIIPLLPFYAEYYQATPAQVGFLMATYSLAQFVAAPFWGRLSDRIGRKPVLLLSMGGAAISYAWLGYSESLWTLFAARAIGGFMAGNISTAFAYVADVTTRENRARGMGMIGAAFGIGFIIGPALGGYIAGVDPVNADFRSPAFAAAALSAAAFLLTSLILKESLPENVRQKLADQPRQKRHKQFIDALAKPVVGQLLFISFLATVAFAGLEATFAMWALRQFGWGPLQTGYLFAFIGILSAMIQGGLIGRLTKRFGERNLIIQGAASLSVGIFLIPFSDNLPMLVSSMSIAAYGFSVISPALSSSLSLQVGENEQGGMMGASRSATTLARVAGPALAGALFGALGKDWPYFGGALIMALVVVLALRVKVESHEKPQPNTSDI